MEQDDMQTEAHAGTEPLPGQVDLAIRYGALRTTALTWLFVLPLLLCLAIYESHRPWRFWGTNLGRIIRLMSGRLAAAMLTRLSGLDWRLSQPARHARH